MVFFNWEPFTSLLRQVKGCAVGPYMVMKSFRALAKALVLLKLAPRNALRDMMLNHSSTWLSQLADVGVKWKKTVGCAAN